jgi:DNA-binding HxlR family transcriptional regulator
MNPRGSRRRVAVATLEHPDQPTSCCPHFHRAVELVGKRWTGAILYVLLESGRPLRFSEIAHAVPALSDRLLSERMKELEAAGIVERHVTATSPVRVEYELTERGRELDPALGELKRWADRWLD